ncbi:hypothetical protein [Amycolatopsis sp. NPDC059657]|uniref:hypothetical protein n=1 Tax=Amycolatopsis sp. NPDC059657 TaxID=3346899 RepID=UPI00367003B0
MDTNGQAARFLADCQRCGAPTEGWVAQVVRDGRLRWEVDLQCSACGLASCDWGWEPAAAWVRDELLARHGPRRLELVDPEARGGHVLKAFRDGLGFSLGEAQRAARTLRRSGYEATYAEARLVADLLGRAGIDSTLGPADTLPPNRTAVPFVTGDQ